MKSGITWSIFGKNLWAALLGASLLLSGCSGGGNDGGVSAVTYSVEVIAEPAEGGSVSGAGSYHADTSVTVSASPNTGYAFVNWTEDGEEISVEADYTFNVSADRSLIGHFSPVYTIGGTVTGLASGTRVVLQNNGGDDLTLDADGGFTFASPMHDGESYQVTVATQPTSPNQTCTVNNGSSTLDGADVTNVNVACTTNTYNVRVNVSGLSGTVVFQNNGGDDLPVSADGIYSFSTLLFDGTGYAVTVQNHPVTQVCTVSDGLGTLTGADVTVDVSCEQGYSIGGQVSGLASGTSFVLQNNGGDDLTIDADGVFTFAALLPNGGSYEVTVSAQPDGQECTVSNGSGLVSGSDVTGLEVTCINLVLPLYLGNGASWNDYVVNDGTTLFNASDTACTGGETGGYSACIHGGERRFFQIDGETSCTGLNATDALDAFDWHCDDSLGYVRFISGRLKVDKRMSDLIDFTAPAWKENAVTVKNVTTTVATSPSSRWWSNPLVIDNDGASEAEMDAAGTIYLVTADTQAAYSMGADKVGIVIKPGVTLQGLGTGTFLGDMAVISGAGKFLWIEGSVNALGNNHGLYLKSSRFSVVRGVRAVNATDNGVYVVGSNNNLSWVNASNCQKNGVIVDGAHNLIVGVTASASYQGLSVWSWSTDTVVQNVTAVNNWPYNVYIVNYSTNSMISGLAVANGSRGLLLNTYSSDNTVADVASAHNFENVYLSYNSNNTFTGRLDLGHLDRGCYISYGTDPGLVDGTCENQGASDATLTSGIDMSTSFVGKVMVDDPANGSDSSGTALYPTDPATFDWTAFANDFRAWGIDDGVAFPSVDQQAEWATGNGRIWDWSLAVTDTVIRDVLPVPTGNDSITHTWSDGSTVTFLRHAVEVDGDGDGLCESNETCLYTPNLGSYQGHGALVSAGTVTDGTVSGVKLVKYETNGR